MQRASGAVSTGGSLLAASYCLGLCRRSARGFLPPAFVRAVATTIGHRLRAGIELRLLRGRQNGANLRVFLSANGLATLHHLASLLHVATERGAIALLASCAGSVHKRLGLRAKRFVLRLILLTDRLDLRLLGVGQVEITSKLSMAAHLAASASTAAEVSAVRARGR